MKLMPHACGLPLVQKITIGTESSRSKGELQTVRAKFCCAHCGIDWSPVTRTSDESPTIEDAALKLAARIEADHVEHHAAAITAEYAKTGAFMHSQLNTSILTVCIACTLQEGLLSG